jgi:hypothetical protein
VSPWVNKNFLRIFFATDVHGSDVTFSKFLNAAGFYKADVLILGGDTTGKLIVPLMDLGNKTYLVKLLGQELTISPGPSLEDVLRTIHVLGFYPYYTTKQEWQEIDADQQRYSDLFQKLSLERWEGWVSLVERKLKDQGTSVFITGGNDDPPYVEQFLKKQQFIIDPEGRIVKVGDLFDMLSLGYSNPTPWKTPRECSEEDLGRMIDGLVSQVPDPSKLIFNIHVPPYNSSIDVAPMVDGSVTPPRYVLRDGMPQNINAGSTAVRAAIEKYQPILALHGHIHESRGAMKIGKTVCINPGSEYGEGVLRGVMLNLDAKGLKSYQLTSG